MQQSFVLLNRLTQDHYSQVELICLLDDDMGRLTRHKCYYPRFPEIEDALEAAEIGGSDARMAMLGLGAGMPVFIKVDRYRAQALCVILDHMEKRAQRGAVILIKTELD